MRKLNRREQVLLVLLGATGIALWMGLRGDGLGFGGPAGGPAPLAALDGEPPSVRVDLLAMAAVNYDPKGRNLFDYYTPPPPPRPKPKPRPKPPSLPPPPKPKNTTPRKQVVREPQPPTPDFAYVGFLGPKDDRIAVFIDGEEMIVARVGEVVEEQFELQEFKYETVIFGFTDKRFKDKTAELKLSASD